jgi:magnesium-transporting ATPase (P-type)
MSLVVKHEGQIYLMCKGADSIMLPRCDFNSPEEKEDEVNISYELLNFAKEGLRTLVVA